VQPLLDDDYVRSIATGGGYSATRLLSAYARRLRTLRSAGSYGLLWIYAELFPGLPGIVEALARRCGTPFIYDCDDAFFHAHEGRPWTRDKLCPLIASAAAVSAGNEYLATYARRWNGDVHIVPTVVDTEAYIPAPRPERPVTIGWIGSPSTWTYVRPMLPLLADICKSRGAQFLAVGAGRAAAADCFEEMELRDWSEATEIADVQAMDIGIMPLPDEPWARGKCGYKLIQYMACGLPTVASPVGVNGVIVQDKRTGFLARDEREWRIALDHLVESSKTRVRFGATGRARIVADYSLAAWAPKVVGLFRSALSAR